MSDPLITERTCILVKLEPSNAIGTDAVPTGAANAIDVDKVTVKFVSKVVERKPIRPYYGAAKKTTASMHATVEIELPFAASGAAGVVPHWDVLAQVGGASSTVVEDTSVTYAPVTNGAKTASAYVNFDGNNHVLTSMRGTLVATTNAEGLGILKFSGTCLAKPLAAAALPAPVYSGVSEPLPINKENTTLTVHGIACVASQFSMDWGTAVMYRNRIGSERIDHRGRNSSFSATVENVSVATKDWVAAHKRNDQGTLSLVHGTVAGKIITISAPAAQLGGDPNYGEDEGVHTIDLAGSLLPTGAGNNEWAIVLT